MLKNEQKSRLMLILSMAIFGTIGILRRYIPYSSSIVALVRGIIGSAFLVIIVTVRKKSFDKQAIKGNLLLLVFSGAAIGFNWIFLFEAYNYTSVATATLCYYLAPIIVILLSPIVLKERLTSKKIACTIAATIGTVLISGILDNNSASGNFGSQTKGIVFGLLAALLYASVILMNKKMKPIPAYDKTILQLSMASATLLPYVIFTENLGEKTFAAVPVLLLVVAGIVHTGIAYTLYFSSISSLKSHTVALLSYIDPILAVLLSMVILKEPMTVSAAIGSVLILGASFISE